jgi:exosortase A
MSAVLPAAAVPSPWRSALPAMALVLLVIGLLYRDTFVAMAAIWTRSETFAHAWLVPPIVLWLVWRLRAELKELTPRPAPWVLLPMAVVALGWLLADLAGINAASQLAVTALLVLSVPAVLGLQVAHRLMFPLGFLFFMVPIGEFTTDIMMEWTADFTVWALAASGIPVYREGLQFIIPSGSWSVVEACSGVRYLIASFMVGTLFAYLNYSTPWRRWVFVGVSILVPIVANWFRAYLIVMLGHLSGNKLAVGVDHLVYGWVFFGIVIGLMFFIGSRWSEPPAEPPRPSVPSHAEALASRPARLWWAAAVTGLVLALAPASAWKLQHPAVLPSLALSLPALPGAEARADQNPKLLPVFEGAAAQAHQIYRAGDAEVTVHVAYYRYQGFGAKLASSSNVLVTSTDTTWKRLSSGRTELPATAGAGAIPLRTAELVSGATGGTHGRTRLLVRQVYWSGGRLTTSNAWATAYSTLSRLTGRGDDGAMLTFYLAGDDAGAQARLEAFIARQLPALLAHLEQVRARP